MFGAFCETIGKIGPQVSMYLWEGSCASDFSSFSCSSSSGRLDGIWSTADVGALKLFPTGALQKSEFAETWSCHWRVYACGIDARTRGEHDSDPTGYAAASAVPGW